jgi:hypothetical protein
VDTIDMLPLKEPPANKKIHEAAAPGGQVDCVSIEYGKARPEIPRPHRIVLWHVSKRHERLVSK